VVETVSWSRPEKKQNAYRVRLCFLCRFVAFGVGSRFHSGQVRLICEEQAVRKAIED